MPDPEREESHDFNRGEDVKRRTVHVLLIAGAVLLAGCAGGVPGSPASPAADESPTATQTADGTRTSTPVEAPEDGTVAFYLSDEENAIGDFRHLNVTVTRVGFEQASAAGGGWVEREVNDTTVDLTGLQGANATLVEEYDLPNGTYGKVFVHVGAVNATLQDGEQVRVKLPSQKLQLTKTFTVGNGSGVNFVFDITVHKAGNSGKYILKPVVSESGTDVPIRPTDDEAEDEEDELAVQFVDNVSQGANATLSVTRNGSGVANATVVANDERVGTTDADGQLTVEIPNAEELEVEVEHGDEEGELELSFESEDEEESDEKEEGEDEEDENQDETALDATFVTNVSQGENATLSVTRNGSGVANATVVVNDERVGATDADGELTFAVPTAEELTVVVEADDEDVELEREFESE